MLVVEYENNMMNEQILEKELFDVNTQTIDIEIKLFWGDLADINPIVHKDGYFLLEGENICISGDNLITRKQMYRRMLHKRKAPEYVKNNNDLSAYVFLPYISGNPYSSVNKMRACGSGYGDNPFAFLNTLKRMYLCNFQMKPEERNCVENAIILTKNFWRLFGEDEEGYVTYLKTFCLECVLLFEKSKKYGRFFANQNFEESYWELYCELLNEFEVQRREALKKRINLFNNKLKEFISI